MKSRVLVLLMVLIFPIQTICDSKDPNGKLPISTATPDSQAVVPTVPAPLAVTPQKPPAPPKSRTDSIPIVKHRYQHRQQIITGSVVMACLTLIMVTMNNYNPR
jgi:hypothetical protein